MFATNSLASRGLHVALVGLASLGALAATPNGAKQKDHSLAINVDDARPLASAVQVLEERYGWVITYEDPPYVHPNEISDVTSVVRKDYDATKPKVLIPRGGPFTFSRSITAGTGVPEQASTLSALLEAYHLSGNPGVFRVVRTGTVFHVVPVMSRGLAGTLEPRRSILDTNISVTNEDRTAFGMLEAIRDAISRSSGIRIMIGTVPMNLLYHVRVHGGADNESARTVLLRTLEGTNRKLSWQLFRDGGPAGQYGLNIHVVRGPAPQGR